MGIPVPVVVSSLLLCLFALTRSAPDRIVLRNGSVLEGTIVSEDGEMIEIALSTGGVVGLERSLAVEIAREPRAAAEDPSAPKAPEVAPRDEWFLVRDRRGAVVGTRHTVRCGDKYRGKGAVRLEEVWRFFEEEGETLVSEIEWADAGGDPLAFHYREESPAGSRLLLAEVRGEELRLSRTDASGARQESLPFPRGTRLPLQARDGLREKQLGTARSYSFAVFDPREETFVRRDFECPAERRAPLPGGDLPLFVLVETRFGRRSEEWVDPRRGTVLFEANGPDLVGHRSSLEEASGAREASAGMPVGLVAAANGRLRFSLPNPNWEPLPGGEAGASFFHDRASGALLSILPLADLDPSVLIEGACLHLEAKLRGSVEGFEREAPLRETSVRGLPAREIRFGGRGANGKVVGRAVVVRGERESLGLVLLAPESSLALSFADFDRFLSGADPNL